MKEMESLEQTMSQWRPRQPSDRVAQRLFGKSENLKAVTGGGKPSGLRRAEFWSWATPLAACAFTILLAVGSTVHRGDTFGARSGSVFFAGIIANPSSSNSPQMVELTAMDENVQWNACPDLAPMGKRKGNNGRLGGTNLNQTF